MILIIWKTLFLSISLVSWGSWWTAWWRTAWRGWVVRGAGHHRSRTAAPSRTPWGRWRRRRGGPPSLWGTARPSRGLRREGRSRGWRSSLRLARRPPSLSPTPGTGNLWASRLVSAPSSLGMSASSPRWVLPGSTRSALNETQFLWKFYLRLRERGVPVRHVVVVHEDADHSLPPGLHGGPHPPAPPAHRGRHPVVPLRRAWLWRPPLEHSVPLHVTADLRPASVSLVELPGDLPGWHRLGLTLSQRERHPAVVTTD